ncbi:hypothetical protein LNS37_004662 [Salmonella enterica]|nr:hypothetical protein [Salmonella enterica]
MSDTTLLIAGSLIYSMIFCVVMTAAHTIILSRKLRKLEKQIKEQSS